MNELEIPKNRERLDKVLMRLGVLRYFKHSIDFVIISFTPLLGNLGEEKKTFEQTNESFEEILKSFTIIDEGLFPS